MAAHRPFAILRIDGLAVNVAEVRVVGVREFPQHDVSRVRLAEGGRVGHVKCVEPLSAAAERTNEHGAPVAAQLCIRDLRCPVNVIAVRVVGTGQLGEIRECLARDVCKLLLAGVCGKAVQHAVVRANIQHLRPVEIRVAECPVARVRYGRVGPSDEDRVRVDDIAEPCAGTLPENRGRASLPRSITAQIVQSVGTARIDDVRVGVLLQVTDERRADLTAGRTRWIRRPAKRHAIAYACRVVVGDDRAAGCGHRVQHESGVEHGRGIDGHIRIDRICDDATAPVRGVEARLIDGRQRLQAIRSSPQPTSETRKE